jgi:hypothetical protein
MGPKLVADDDVPVKVNVSDYSLARKGNDCAAYEDRYQIPSVNRRA